MKMAKWWGLIASDTFCLHLWWCVNSWWRNASAAPAESSISKFAKQSILLNEGQIPWENHQIIVHKTSHWFSTNSWRCLICLGNESMHKTSACSWSGIMISLTINTMNLYCFRSCWLLTQAGNALVKKSALKAGTSCNYMSFHHLSSIYSNWNLQ